MTVPDNEFKELNFELTEDEQEQGRKLANEELLNAFRAANEKDGSFQEIIDLFQ